MKEEQSVYVRYIVNDVNESIDFYRNQLKFELIAHPAKSFAIIALNNLRLLLSEPGSGGGGHVSTNGEIPKPGGWNRIHIPVENLNVTFTELKKKGNTFKTEIVKGAGGKQALLQDPSGNLIELFEPKIE